MEKRHQLAESEQQIAVNTDSLFVRRFQRRIELSNCRRVKAHDVRFTRRYYICRLQRPKLLCVTSVTYLKIIKYFKIFACAHNRKRRKQTSKKKIWQKCFFSFVRVCARRQIFLVFEAYAIFRPLSNDLNLTVSHPKFAKKREWIWLENKYRWKISDTPGALDDWKRSVQDQAKRAFKMKPKSPFRFAERPALTKKLKL